MRLKVFGILSKVLGTRERILSGNNLSPNHRNPRPLSIQVRSSITDESNLPIWKEYVPDSRRIGIFYHKNLMNDARRWWFVFIDFYRRVRTDDNRPLSVWPVVLNLLRQTDPWKNHHRGHEPPTPLPRIIHPTVLAAVRKPRPAYGREGDESSGTSGGPRTAGWEPLD